MSESISISQLICSRLAIKPIFITVGGLSKRNACTCRTNISTPVGLTAISADEFCTVLAVIKWHTSTLRLWPVLISAAIPAPPEQSAPEMVQIIGLFCTLLPSNTVSMLISYVPVDAKKAYLVSVCWDERFGVQA